MENDLTDRPKQDPYAAKSYLSESAQIRIGKIADEGYKARRAAELAHSRQGDPESALALNAANFDYAFAAMAATKDELKAAGLRGEKLGEIMSAEIEDVANSLELQDVGEKQLRDLLVETDFGW